MTFLHKLAQRLARLWIAPVIGIFGMTTCKLPPARPTGPPDAVARLDLAPPSLTLLADRATDFVVVALTANNDTVNSPVNWTTSGGTIAPMSDVGGVQYARYTAPVLPGNYKVFARTSVGGVVDSSVVSVSAVPVSSVSVSPVSANLTTGQTVQLTATPRDASGNPLSGRVVTWTTSVAAAATVNGNGLVTGQGAGTATITATSEGQSSSAAITVTQPVVPVASVSVTPTSVSLTLGQTSQLTATPRDAGGNPLTGRVVTWTSNSAAVATVNGNGLVTGQGAGTATITATSEGQSGTAAITVTPPAVPVASVSVAPATLNVTVAQSGQLTATPRDASGNPLTGRVVTWTSNSAAVATVNGNGLVTGGGAGTATITATSEGQSGTSAVTVTLAPVASVSVSPATTNVAVGGTVPLGVTLRDASGNVLSGRIVTWSSNAASVATVNGNGLVTALVVGTATITATSEGQTGTAAVTVTTPPPPGTAWPNEPAGFTVLSDYDFSDPLTQGQGVPVGSSGWRINNGYASLISDPTAPLSPASVFQWTYPVGFQAGSAPATMYYSLNTANEMYFGFWWEPSNPWQNEQGSNVNKIFFLMGSGSADLLIIQLEGPAPWGIAVQAEFNTDNSHLANVTCGSSPGTCLLHGNVAQPTVALGQWHRIEFQVRQSTSPTSRDGLIRWWMDGILIGDYTTANYPTGNWIETQLSPTWGGGSNTKTEQDYYRFDHLHMSRR